MVSPRLALEGAALDTRVIANQMSSIVDDLTTRGAWVGRDADSFRARWAIEVMEPLRAAANTLDGIEFDEVGSLLGALIHV